MISFASASWQRVRTRLCQLHGNGEGRKHKAVQLRLCQPVDGLADKAPAECTELRGIEVDASGVRLILGGGVCDKAHGIAEIVHGHAGHDRVEVDDDDRHFGDAVEQDIVRFCVIVRHAHGELAVRIADRELACLPADRRNIFDLLTHLRCSAAGILRDMLKQRIKALFGIVKIRDRLKELRAVEIRELVLEMPEGLSGRGNNGQVVAGIERNGIDPVHHAPEAAVIVKDIVFAVGRMMKMQGALIRIFLADMRGHKINVVHDLHGIAEHDRVDALKNIRLRAALVRPVGHAVGRVDVAVGDDIERVERSGQAERGADFSDRFKHR